MTEIRLCGVRIDNITLAGAVERALFYTGEPCVVTAPDALVLESCRKDRNLAELLNTATLSLPAGATVVRAAKRKKTPLCGQVGGVPFAEALMERAAEDGLRVFLLGGGSGVAAAASRYLVARYPGIRICGTCWGGFDPLDEEARLIPRQIVTCRPDVLLVGMGFPRGEEWMIQNRAILSSVRIIAGVGNGLERWASRNDADDGSLSAGERERIRRTLFRSRLRELPALVRFLHSRQGQPGLVRRTSGEGVSR